MGRALQAARRRDRERSVIAALLRALRRRGIEVPVTQHDLIAELRAGSGPR